MVVHSLELDTNEIIESLRDVRSEISRLNSAAGETVFNPTATALLDVVLESLEQGLSSERQRQLGLDEMLDVLEGTLCEEERREERDAFFARAQRGGDL